MILLASNSRDAWWRMAATRIVRAASPARLARFAVMAALCGCGKTPEPLRYEPPPLSGPFLEVAVPPWQQAASSSPPNDVSTPRTLKRDESLVFTGKVRSADVTDDAYPAIFVTFYGPLRGKDGVIIAQGMATPKKSSDGLFTYRVEVKAPEEGGHCRLEVTDGVGTIIARGEADVE